MPIYNLNLRKQMVGKAGNIRKGIKEPVLNKKTNKPEINPKTGEIVTRPAEVDYFVFKIDGADPELEEQVKQLYDKPKKITAFLAASDKARTWDYWFEAYNFNQLLARSDGITVTYLFDTVTRQKIIDKGRIVEVPTKETPVSELLGNLGVGDVLGYYDGMVVARNQDGEPIFFDAHGRLNVILRDLRRQLTWTLHTGGLYGDVPHITEMVDIIQDLSTAMKIPAVMIPFTLTRYEVQRNYTDKNKQKRHRKGWDIRMEVLPEFFSGVLEVYRNSPLMLAATNPTTPTPPPADYIESDSAPYISEDLPEWDNDIGVMEGEPPIQQNGEPPSELRPYQPEALKTKINDYADYHIKNQTKVNEKAGQILASSLNTIFGNETDRYVFTAWIFGEGSTKSLKGSQIQALLDWLEVARFGHMPAESAIVEAKMALTHINKLHGQQEFL